MTTPTEKLKRSTSMLIELEWSSYADCEGMGFMGSGPPMHLKGHPGCPICHGLRPEQEHDKCFRDEAKGHRKGCRLAEIIQEPEA